MELMIKQVVMPCGGLGTRLRPLTYNTPKTMIEVRGKPFLEHVITLLKNQGFKDFLLLTGYKHEVIENYFGDGSNFGLNIEYCIEDKSLGTGGTILHAKDFLDDSFLLILGDTYYPIDYRKMVSIFEKGGKLGLMTAYSNEERVAENNVWIEDGFVKAYVKRESHDSSKIGLAESEALKKLNGVDTGSCIYSKDIIQFFPKMEEFSLEKEVYHRLIENEQFLGHLSNVRFFDIGTFERIKKFELLKL